MAAPDEGTRAAQVGATWDKVTREPRLESHYPTRFIRVKAGYSLMNGEWISAN
jgi:hypothetical protein